MPTPEHLTVQTSGRGFSRLPPIPSTYGGNIEVYESSAASGPHLWVKLVCPASLNEPDGPTIEAVAHLRVEDAVQFAEQIQALAAAHYQG